MSKSEKKSPSHERPVIQAALEKRFSQALVDLELPAKPNDLDDDHFRRTVRAVARIAAKTALLRGCPPQTWMAIAMEAYAKESGMDKATSPEEAATILSAKLNAKGDAN